MALSSNKRARIVRLIREHHMAFAVDALGEDAVPAEFMHTSVVQPVTERGAVHHAQVAFPAMQAIGAFSAATDHKLARMTPEAFWKFIEHAPPQFSPIELDAIQATKAHVGRLIKGMGEDVVEAFEHAAHEDLAIVRHEIALGIARGKSNEQIERRLKTKIDDTERNWTMIVRTELHNAKEHGKALALTRRGRDPHVYKLPKPDACRFCKLLYLVNGKRPRIFRLSELAAHGTNYGRRGGRPQLVGDGATEWKPTIGALHPLCQCELHEMPDGHMFDRDGKVVQSTRKSMEPDELPDALRSLIGHRCEA